MQTAELKDKIDQTVQTSLAKLQESIDQISETVRSNASVIQKAAQENLRIGKRRAQETEAVVSQHVKDNQSIYLLALVGLFGVIAAKIIFDKRSR